MRASFPVLGPKFMLVRVLVKFVPAVTYHFCLNLLVAFSQPRASVIFGPSLARSHHHLVDMGCLVSQVMMTNKRPPPNRRGGGLLHRLPLAPSATAAAFPAEVGGRRRRGGLVVLCAVGGDGDQAAPDGGGGRRRRVFRRRLGAADQ